MNRFRLNAPQYTFSVECCSAGLSPSDSSVGSSLLVPKILTLSFSLRFNWNHSLEWDQEAECRIVQPHWHKKDHRKWLLTFDLFISNRSHQRPKFDSVTVPLTDYQNANLHAKKAIKLSTDSLLIRCCLHPVAALLSLWSGQSLEEIPL